eukprot:1095084_1
MRCKHKRSHRRRSNDKSQSSMAAPNTTHQNKNTRALHHPIAATSMTHTPSMINRLHSKSVNQVSNGYNAAHSSHSMTTHHHGHYGGHQHQGSMTPQHHRVYRAIVREFGTSMTYPIATSWTS